MGDVEQKIRELDFYFDEVAKLNKELKSKIKNTSNSEIERKDINSM